MRWNRRDLTEIVEKGRNGRREEGRVGEREDVRKIAKS